MKAAQPLLVWSRQELTARRSALIRRVQEAVSSASSSTRPVFILLKGADPLYFCGTQLPVAQSSYLRYLSGCRLARCHLLIEADGPATLFFDRRTKSEETWDGVQPSDLDICNMHAVDQIAPISSMGSYLDKLTASSSSSASSSTIACVEPSDYADYADLIRSFRVEPANMHIDHLRLIKSPAEREAMRVAGSVGARAMASAMRAEGGRGEGELAARILLEIRRRGGHGFAYPPVVAAGDRACTIHYLEVEGSANVSECFLVDAGADVEGYLSDITRCWPADRVFTPAQRTLYDALETVQLTLIQEAKKGDVVLNHLFNAMLELLGQAFEEVGLFLGSPSKKERDAIVNRLCPHHVSHYLGLDVHDSPSVSRGMRLPPGVVFTIEPAVYVHRGDPDVRQEFHGIGFRIEDDVMTSEDNSIEVLTEDCPRSVEDIEYLRSHSQ